MVSAAPFLVGENVMANKEKQRAYSAAWRAANKEKERARQAAWRTANKEKNRAYSAAWYAANGEEQRARQAAYRAANLEKERARHAAYRAANKEERKARQAAYYAANREAVRAKQAAQRYKTSVEHILSIQAAGKCAICGSSYRLHIDHDHKTGQLRGLLCHFCNTGLGHFRDSPERLRAAIAYLMKHRMRGAA